MLSIRAEFRKDDHRTVFNAPSNDYGVDIVLQNLGETDMTKTKQFCAHLGGDVRELAVLIDRFLDIDELNFLAKRLDSFDDRELNQFKAAVLVAKPVELKDMINLTFNLQNYTLITDFSDLSDVGKRHRLNVEMAIPTDDSYDYYALGESLVSSGTGVMTSYGALFVNGLPMEDLYDGQTFPQYYYEDCVFGVAIENAGKQEYLYLPCDDSAIDRAIHRLGTDSVNNVGLKNLDSGFVPISLDQFLTGICPNYDNTDIYDLNKLASAVTEFSKSDFEKLLAVCDYAETDDFGKAALLAENLDSFEYAKGAQDTDDLGKYLIKDSGSYSYDDALDNYYDYEALGADTEGNQNGRFTSYGYVGIKDDVTLDEILGEESDEMTMGGI